MQDFGEANVASIRSGAARHDRVGVDDMVEKLLAVERDENSSRVVNRVALRYIEDDITNAIGSGMREEIDRATFNCLRRILDRIVAGVNAVGTSSCTLM